MLRRTDRRRLSAVLIVLLSHLASGLAVLCDEGSGRLLLEVVSRSCCEVGGEAPLETGRDSCRCCQDAPFGTLVSRETDEARSERLVPRPDTARPFETRCAAPAGRPSAVGRRLTVPLPPSLAGTVVLTC